MPLEQGQVLNQRYRIVARLGQNVHGAVYRAWDMQNQSPCILREYLDARLDERELLRNEAQRLFNLHHPNLASVSDFFSVPGQGEYLVLEYIEGESLDTILKASDRRPSAVIGGQQISVGLPEAQVLPWFLQISEALSYLHIQNPPILHGEVKPANIIVALDGRAFLTGLGLSPIPDRQAQPVSGSKAPSSGFSAPEQYGAAQLDVRSDVYALGATLYTLVTGLTPPDSIDIITGSASLTPARQLNPQISPELDRLLQQSMQPNRNARLPDMRAFNTGLTAAYTRLISPAATVATHVASGASSPPPASPPAPAESNLGSKGIKNQTLLIAIGALVVFCIILAGLWFLNYRRGGSDQSTLAGTVAAQTLEAHITQNAALTAIALGTQTVTVTPSPEATTGPSTPTITNTPAATPQICEKASFVSDVSVPDNTVMNPLTLFTKIWRVRNDSQCTWDSNYALVFAGGTLMANQNTIPFPGKVPPGQTVDLAVNMQAPATSGAIQSNWLLRTPNNATFGVGGAGDNPLYVRILVTTPVLPDARFSYDFVANACRADWNSAVGVISCNNISSDERGSSLALAYSPLERGQENEAGLWVRPNQNNNGFIYGLYPSYTIQPGDHFVTEIGCAQGSNGCNVDFKVQMLGQSASIDLGEWNETYDGKTRVIDIDLTPYAGQNVRFSLRMTTIGPAAMANGIWFLPSVRNSPVSTLPTPTSTSTSPYP